MAFELPFLFASSKGGSMYLGGVARGSPGCFSVFCRPLFAACGRFTLISRKTALIFTSLSTLSDEWYCTGSIRPIQAPPMPMSR